MKLNINSKDFSAWFVGNGLGNSVPIGVAVGAGLLVGFLAFSGKALFVLLLFGAIAAFALMSRPILLLYLAFLFTLVIGGMIKYLVPNFGTLSWLGYLLAAALYLPALIALLTNRNRLSGKTRPEDFLFAWSVSGFILVAIVGTVLSGSSGEQLLGAIKTYVMYAGVWAALSWLVLSEATMHRLLVTLVGVGLVQWVVTIFQYIYAKTFRVDAQSATASDAVVGTFGGNPDSGGLSAVLTLYLVLVICAIIQAYRGNQLTKSRTALFVVLLFIPLLLTEVKALFIYLPVSLLVLFRDKIKQRPLQFALSIPIIAIGAMAGLFMYFSLHWSGDGGDIQTAIEKSFSYSFATKEGEDALNPDKLSRREVIEFWWKENRNGDLGRLFLGHGLGASKVGGRLPGPVGQQYRGLNIDANGLSVLLWDTGLFGAMFVITIFGASCITAMRLATSAALNSWERILSNVLAVAFVLFIIALPYRNDIPYAAPMMLIVMASFGFLSWLKRQDASGKVSIPNVSASIDRLR